jgi:hypothetical protein
MYKITECDFKIFLLEYVTAKTLQVVQNSKASEITSY